MTRLGDTDQAGAGPVFGPVSCAVLGVTFVVFGLFELSIAQIMGPGNSDELVTGGPVLIPWFGLPAVAIGLGGVAVACRRRLRLAHRALGLAAACLAAWLVPAAVL
jgi:ABC-type taurine transport system ATPase subunit